MNGFRASLMMILPIVVGFGLMGAGLFMVKVTPWVGILLIALGAVALWLNLRLRRGPRS